jgi:hypothetical protein
MNQLCLECKTDDKLLFVNQLRYIIWLLGFAAWLFAVAERIFNVLTNPNPSSQEIIQALINCFFFFIWLFLKPDNSLHRCNQAPVDLRASHLISQEYILPFSYLCQVYHLLNLKHLETIHNFSLNNLKIDSITQIQKTSQGGAIKFKTSLNSPLNPLRIWRQMSVEVDLILHNLYTIELSIPIYSQKRMVVLFNVLPLTSNEHYFFIDIYGDLQWWLKPLMQILLHFAACLTLFEDLPYLHALSERNIEKLFLLNKSSKYETMYLYNRYVEISVRSKHFSACL